MESGVTTCTSYSSRQHDITINQLRGCRWEISSHERFSICGFPGGPRTSGNEEAIKDGVFPTIFPIFAPLIHKRMSIGSSVVIV